jgi:hypothetical protein
MRNGNCLIIILLIPPWLKAVINTIAYANSYISLKGNDIYALILPWLSDTFTRN